MYIRFGKVFHFLTIVTFLFVFLYIYSAFSETVAYSVDSEGKFLSTLSKDTFFFIEIVVFLVCNLLIITPAKLIENQVTPKLKRMFPIGDDFREYILAWFYSFTGILNISLGLISFFIHRINHQEEINAADFNFIYYLVPILLVIWILALFWIFIQKVNSLKSRS
jgi:hypothetical protein